MENDIRALVLTLLLSVAAAPRAGAQADFRLEPVMDTPTAELALSLIHISEPTRRS